MVKNKLAVLLLNYNSYIETLDISKKIVANFNIAWKDIVIVDNYSLDDSREYFIENIRLGYTYLETSKNGGYAYGNNVGLRYARKNGYKYAWIVNNDIIIDDKNYLNKILNVFIKNSVVATVNPDIYSPGGYLYNRDSIRPTFYDYTFGMLSYKKRGRKINNFDGYAYVYRPQGCCMIVDLNKLDEIDYFDENTFLYHEESILAEKLLKKGYRCCVCTNVNVIHNHSKIVKDNINKINIIRINNKSFAYYLREYRKFNKVKTYICLIFNFIKLFIID